MKTSTYCNLRIAHVVIAIVSATLIGLAFVFPAVTTTICDTNAVNGKLCADIDLYVHKVIGCMGGECTTVSVVDGLRKESLTYISSLKIGNHTFKNILNGTLEHKVLFPFHVFGNLSIISLFIACILVVPFIIFPCIDVSIWASCFCGFFSMLVFFSCFGIGATILAISTMLEEIKTSDNFAAAILIICGGLLQLLQAFLLSCLCCGQSTHDEVDDNRRVSRDIEMGHASTDIRQNRRNRRFSGANSEMESSTVPRYSNIDSHEDPHNPMADDKCAVTIP